MFITVSTNDPTRVRQVPPPDSALANSPVVQQARSSVVKIRGIPVCGACAREQEVYFAIGELTQGEEKRDLRSEPLSKLLSETLGEMLDGMRRQRTDDLAASSRLNLPRADKTWRLAPTKS